MEHLRPYFEHVLSLTDDEWADFSQHLRVREYRRKEYVLSAGDCCTEFSFIERGAVGYFMFNGEKDVCFEILLDNEFFVSMQSFVRNIPSDFSIQCFEDTRVIYIHREHFIRYYLLRQERDRVPPLSAENMMVRIQQRVISLTCLSVDERYRELVTRAPAIVQRIPLIHIASYLGMTHETLSRVRKRIKF